MKEERMWKPKDLIYTLEEDIYSGKVLQYDMDGNLEVSSSECFRVVHKPELKFIDQVEKWELNFDEEGIEVDKFEMNEFGIRIEVFVDEEFDGVKRKIWKVIMINNKLN